MAYYTNGISVTAGGAQYTNAAVNARFKGMNVLTTLDALPIKDGFDAYTTMALTGYKWGGTQINYVPLASLRRDLTYRPARARVTAGSSTFSNTLAHPRVYYVIFQAAGGAGSTDSGYTGCGGGSGSYTHSKVILQPGSSFSVTHSTTSTTIKIVTGSAYTSMAGMVSAGYSYSITATAGSAATKNEPGAGFRSGGREERDGAPIDVDTIRVDGYACPRFPILGGLAGQNRVSYSSAIEENRGGGGGGASAGFHLNYPVTSRSGGGGAFYYKDTYHTYSLAAEPGIYGGGGGGGEGSNPGAAGGPASTIVYY